MFVPKMMSASAPMAATADEASESGLPAFTTFQATELENGWDYYDRSMSSQNNSDISSQPNNYNRPWEAESREQAQQQQQQQQQAAQQHHRGFEPFSKLPSFQSQFHSFADNQITAEPSLPTQITAVPVPISPSSASPSGGSLTQLTQLTSSSLTPLQSALAPIHGTNFHTLTAVNVQPPRGYPLVPAPIQARDLSTVQQQYIDERHIQLYQPISATTFHHPAANQQHGIITVLKNDHYEMKQQVVHSPYHSNNTTTILADNNGFANPSTIIKTESKSELRESMTPIKETKKRGEKRKIRAGSLESSTESDASSAMEIDNNNSGNPGQVAAVSSTEHFKSPAASKAENGDHTSTTSEKQQKQKKRKRCGECVGCQKKDNCGECAPCRNDKSHQICKQRRCEKLTEKKIQYAADGSIVRGDSRRGRGKGRGGGTSYRGRKALNLGGVVSPRAKQPKGQNSPAPAAVPTQSPNSTTTTTTTASVQNQQASQPNITHIAQSPQLDNSQHNGHQNGFNRTPTMKDHGSIPPMTFYPTYHTTPTTTDQTWQNQFMNQIPQNASVATVAPTMGHIELQQTYTYPSNGFVQTNGLQFDPNYGRVTSAYSSPTIQRYELQAQQVPPINQAPLQSVNFAPNMSYTQITTPTMLLNHQQHYPQHVEQLAIKQPSITTSAQSGSDTPGFAKTKESTFNYNSTSSDTSLNAANNNNSSGAKTSDSPILKPATSYPSYAATTDTNANLDSTAAAAAASARTSTPNDTSSSYEMLRQGQSFQSYNPIGQLSPKHHHHFDAYHHHHQTSSSSSSLNYNFPSSQQSVSTKSHNFANNSQQQELNSSPTTGSSSSSSWMSQRDKAKHHTYGEHDQTTVYGSSETSSKPNDALEDEQANEQSMKMVFKQENLSKSDYYDTTKSTFDLESERSRDNLMSKENDNSKYLPTYGSSSSPIKSKSMDQQKQVEASKSTSHRSDFNSDNMKKETTHHDDKDYHNFSHYPTPTPPIDTKPLRYPQDMYQSDYFNNFPSYSDAQQQHSSFLPPQPTTPAPFQPYNMMYSQKPNLTNFEQKIPLHKYSKVDRIDDESCKLPSIESFSPNDKSSSVSYEGAKEPSGRDQSPNTMIRQSEPLPNEFDDKKCPPPTDTKPAQGAKTGTSSSRSKKQAQKEAADKINRPEVPSCDCFPSDKKPPEPGSYYTHLGCAATVEELRKEIEKTAGLTGKQLRIEKVLYTGKEGKSSHGCPIAKWVIRRIDAEEKALFVVKRRQGHRCNATFIVISIVVWDAIPPYEADSMYKLLVHKLNKYGLPTTRRCATNENRTCACQGLDPETCGASYSFGCSWSMYYNGCKYARSKTVRKFRLSVKSEEAEIEEKMNVMATILSPIYQIIAPKSYHNQVKNEENAADCRLGIKMGKPFSGVTCCLDFCAHTHRDLHNMQDGCTVQATLLRPRAYGEKQDDEQLHVLPLYVMDSTDEFNSEEGQQKKHETGAVTYLEKYTNEVRVRSVPLQPCRRHGKKRGNGADEPVVDAPPTMLTKQPPSLDVVPPVDLKPPTLPNTEIKSKSRSKSRSNKTSSNKSDPMTTLPSHHHHGSSNEESNKLAEMTKTTDAHNQSIGTDVVNANNPTTLLDMASMIDNFTDAQLQSNQISSTVLDSPYSYDYQTGQYIDNRNYPYPWSQDFNKAKTEDSPDTTTRPGSSNSSNGNSAFSPKIQSNATTFFDPANTMTTSIKDEAKHYPTHQTSTQQYHQLESPFLKPKVPEYLSNSYQNYQQSPYNHSHISQQFGGYHLSYPSYPYHDPYGYGNYSSNYYGYGQTTAHQSSWSMGAPPSAAPVMAPLYSQNFTQPHHPAAPMQTEIEPLPPKQVEALGEVAEINENKECFSDKQMGGVAIALPHGSIVIECAKLEMHSTTALKRPNRLNPNRISLIFYQHRNLNRPKHGTLEWAEKMRLKKLGLLPECELNETFDEEDEFDEAASLDGESPKKAMPKSGSRSSGSSKKAKAANVVDHNINITC